MRVSEFEEQTRARERFELERLTELEKKYSKEEKELYDKQVNEFYEGVKDRGVGG